MRKSFFVCYDISSPARWRRVYRLMRGYGDHIQLSVFRCILSAREVAELRARLEELIHKVDDHVLIVDSGPADGRGERVTISLGKPLPEATEVVKVL